MTDLRDSDPRQDAPANPARRRLFGQAAVAGAALGLAACTGDGAGAAPAESVDAAAAVLDAKLREHVHNIVVVYLENRSFNNLFVGFPGLAQPLGALDAPAYRQRDRDGTAFVTLPKIWGGLVPRKQTLDGAPFEIGEDALTGLPNQPFALTTPDGRPLPQQAVTRDLVHRFYENQLQINGGRNDGFVAWGNTGAMTMGHYAGGQEGLDLWQLAREFTLLDNFFMGAFGGSFLNHQYLIAAEPPYWPDADRSPNQPGITVLEGDDPAGIRPKLAEDSPASAMDGRPQWVTPHQALTPDFWAVNTLGPAYAPGFNHDPADPRYADAKSPNTLPPQVHATIGTQLDAAGIDWAWYAGAWQLALDGKGEGHHKDFPEVPNFQPHHQPFNYFKAFEPGSAARARHLRDAGTGSDPDTNHFLAAARAGTLPPVVFYKPQGDLNMHAGYSSVAAGSSHLGAVVRTLRASPQWPGMVVIVTVDENGGWWDHVAPPKGDRWGPGTRIPALVISPWAKPGHVEHSVHDTGSILRFITRRFGLETLRGLKRREDAMRAAGGPPPGDLTATLDFDRS